MKYNEAIELLTSCGRFYIDLGLDRILNALEILGNPQDKLKCIHVAGTNGKGSVCAMLESILREDGYKTGLYTSPHIWEYTERIKINGIDIPKDVFANLIEKVCSINVKLTEFEILTVVMFLYFVQENVDIVILETGLGGRLDATNVIKQNLCSIITRIDLDHTDKLGNTKEKIAYEKAGIIKKICPVITGMDFEAIKYKAKEMNSQLIVPPLNVKQKYLNALNLKGEHQAENLALVITAIHSLFKDLSEETLIEGLKNVKHPCRFEFISDKNLIVDASHNPNGIQALRNNLDKYFPFENRRFIFGCLKTKDYAKMMKILFRDGDEVYLNGFNYPNACSYEELKEKCPIYAKKYVENIKLDLNKLNIICGSFYMISKMTY